MSTVVFDLSFKSGDNEQDGAFVACCVPVRGGDVLPSISVLNCLISCVFKETEWCNG